MSNTVITNYTDLNGPSSKADSSVVVIVNKDGSLSVDQNLLGTLMGTDGSQSAGISVVRVGHEGRPDDATDSESEDDKIPHVTLTVDSYYDEPNSIIKYDSGAEMLQSLRIETRENSLIGFQNDHCYTPLTSPGQVLPQRSENFAKYDDPVIEITHTPPPKPVPSSKKITILEQQIIPKGKKIQINPPESPVILKGNVVLSKPLPALTKPKEIKEIDKELKEDSLQSSEDSTESTSTSGDSIPDRDSDSDYRDRKEPSSAKLKKPKAKARILQPAMILKSRRADPKVSRLKLTQHIVKKEIKEIKNQKQKSLEKDDALVDLESLLPASKIAVSNAVPTPEFNKVVVKQAVKPAKKEKKIPSHPALLTDMTALFSTPDVIRRVSTDNKTPGKVEKEVLPSDKKPSSSKLQEVQDGKASDSTKLPGPVPQTRIVVVKVNDIVKKNKIMNSVEKASKHYAPIPQLDDVSLAQILQDTTSIPSSQAKSQSIITTPVSMASPGLAGPLSPTLDLLGGLPPEEDLSEDLLMHVAQLVESSENLQEVIDKQVLGKVDSLSIKTPVQSPFQQAHASNLYTQTLSKTVQKTIQPRKEPIEIVRRDGRVITLPPIEAPATRSSKRKSQINESSVSTMEVVTPVVPAPSPPMTITPEPQLHTVAASKQYVNKKLANKKQEAQVQPPVEKSSAESQESWNSEDDPYRLWCICKQPHNNRFMICCDGCEDWFHGKCVNITKAMGQQMEDQGIEWRCPNCVKRAKAPTPKSASKGATQKRHELLEMPAEMPRTPTASGSKTGCIVCKKPARASSIYCSDACILKHAQDSLGNQGTPTKSEAEPGKLHEKHKSDSRVIVYERKSGRLLAGPNAPTAENLKAWLQKNPTFEVVRPGALSSIKPGTSKKKLTPESTKIQTTLNFERIPRKSQEQTTPTTSRGQQLEGRERRVLPSPKEEKLPKAPTPKPIQLLAETPKPSTSTAKPISEPRKLIRSALNRSQSNEKPAPSPSTSRRKDSAAFESRTKMSAPEVDIRENVRKSLQEQMSLRMAETKRSKFTEDDIQAFAEETELELHELFRDTGMKYKAKYRSLMFNIKDRKNLSLWEKICAKSITPKQLVRLSPDELASQELAQWRDQESKYQLELIKKSELDLLAASKTYVLKTHKGEEVMETKEATELELDPNVPIEDVVTALNDSTVGEEVTREVISEGNKNKSEEKEANTSSRKRERDSSSGRSKRSRRDSRRDSDRKSRASRRKSELKEKESKEERRRSTRRAEKKSKTRSSSRERIKRESKEKSNSSERSRLRSRSRDKVKKRSKSREHSRSTSKGRETSRSIERSRRRSESRDTSRRRNRSRSKHARSDEKSIHRSRSQENYIKNKTDSTDSDSIERPKSAMLKEPHPEYDPHEPMITSAFSEEDLRKPEDAYEDLTYKSEIVDAGAEYDPNKSFTLDTSVILPSTTFTEKASEAESDQEPSSTVENSAATVWNGCINMVDVARFYVMAYEVSGSTLDLEEDLSTELDIVGRINPETVWDYITKTKKTSNKDIIILRLQAANDEEKMQYIALYSYLSSRNRLGVVKVPNTATVKDFYIVPLPAHAALQPVLLPLDGPGLGEAKTHLLIAIIVRQRRKRLAHHIPKNLVPAKVSRGPRKRSYTPPVGKTYTPPTSPRRRALPLPAYTSTALSTSVKDKIAASLACADVEEAYSPGSSSSSGGAAPAAGAPPAAALRNKMEELNRQIEEQKQQILKMAQADSSMGGEDDEAYSPSRPMTPPASTLADISLPSNLQEILATIKQRSENPSTDVDMRNMPLP